MKSKITYYLPLSFLLTFCFIYFLWPRGQDWVSFEIQQKLGADPNWAAIISTQCKKIIPLHTHALENDVSDRFSTTELSDEICFLSVEAITHRYLFLNDSGNGVVNLFSKEKELVYSSILPLYLVTPLAVAPLLFFFFCFVFRVPKISMPVSGAVYLLALYGFDAERLFLQIGRIQYHSLLFKKDFWIVTALILFLSLGKSPLHRWARYLSLFIGVVKPVCFPIMFLFDGARRASLLTFFVIQTFVVMLSFLVIKIVLFGVRPYLASLLETPPYFTLAFLWIFSFVLVPRLKTFFTFSKVERETRFPFRKTMLLIFSIFLCFTISELTRSSQLQSSMVTWFQLKNSSSIFLKFLVTFFYQVCSGNFSFEWNFPNIALDSVVIEAWWIGALFSPFSIFQIVPATIFEFNFPKLYRFSLLVLSRPLIVVFLVYGIVEVTKIRILEPVVFVFTLFVFLYLELQKRHWKLATSS